MGIPGSGGPDWLRADTEWIICATSGGKLPWSDNTACGREPKWKPGGKISHRTTSGERVNASKKTDRRGGRRSFREGPGKFITVPWTDGMETQFYAPPKIANPGNVIRCAVRLEEVIAEILCNAYATKTSPAEVLFLLQQAIGEETIPFWVIGVRQGLRSQKLLQSEVFWDGCKDFGRAIVPKLLEAIPAQEFDDRLLLKEMLRCTSTKSYRSRNREEHGEEGRAKDNSGSSVQSMRVEERFGGASRRRGSNKQRSEESRSALPVVSRSSSQSATERQSAVLRLWVESSEEVRLIGHTLRQTLPEIQKAWVSVSEEDQAWSQLGFGGVSDLIHCKVGGGRMGSSLAHENEAPFPLGLAEFFVRSFCPPNGTVLDPFCGSGTTLEAAVRWSRCGIGVDVRSSQIKLTKRRLAKYHWIS